MKSSRTIFFALLSLILITSCTIPIKTSDDAFLQSTVRVDLYEKTTRIWSPIFSDNLNATESYWYDTSLCAVIRDNRVTSYQLHITVKSWEWKFYSEAYDLSGRRFDISTVDTEIVAGREKAITYEYYSIILDRAYLNEAQSKGIDIKASGRRDNIFRFPSYYVQGFLKKVDEYISGKENIKKQGDSIAQ